MKRDVKRVNAWAVIGSGRSSRWIAVGTIRYLRRHAITALTGPDARLWEDYKRDGWTCERVVVELAHPRPTRSAKR